MGITVKISWLKLGLALILTVINGYFLIRLHRVEERYEERLANVRVIEGELFLIQEQQQQINETYTTTWAQQNKTAEMMFQMGQDICDKRRGLLKKFPNVAHQINNGVKPQSSPYTPWE